MIGAKAWKTRISVRCDQSSFLSKHLDPMIHQLDKGNATLGAEARQGNILFGVKLIVYIQRGEEKRVRFGQIQVRNIRSRSIHLKKL